ncbi:hypothetical protein [Hydrogenophaga palleronii]|uniref:hypothetical protein n=1 Tax=Hydrogenophaga palleronii TaxID=65655 RepID=UPI0008259258|nr:hypothetical protein [Hydrogenophaga palleronii]
MGRSTAPASTAAARARAGAAVSAQGEITDVVLERGLSLHFFDESVAVLSTRIASGDGYAQFNKRDLQVLVDFFRAPENRHLLESAPASARTPGP